MGENLELNSYTLEQDDEFLKNVIINNNLRSWINKIEYKKLIDGINNTPHNLLGKHDFKEGQVFLVYRSNAQNVKITAEDGSHEYNLAKFGDDNIYGAYIDNYYYDKYKIETHYLDGSTICEYDAYAFKPIINDIDKYLFGEGTHYEIYEKLGAHIITIDGIHGTYFAVYAPNAKSVSIVGDFNYWDGRLYPMSVSGTSGIYEIFIPYMLEGYRYKFQIRTQDDRIIYKCDPYENSSEFRPNNASVVTNLNNFSWNDDEWLKTRNSLSKANWKVMPMNIYEVHLGSWRKRNNEDINGFYNYRELAHELADYVIDMGYTHIELMGIAEHPFDGSWGYQVVGYYAPTRRYGTPQDFMYFVNYMHSRGIYVILDWVPAHFPKDEHGLACFDGAPLYEHPDPLRGEHPHWGTYIFNYGKKEIENFLIANALFWLNKYHIDGLRVDAVASMLYLDYGREGGNWRPNIYGGKENLEAISFLKHLNNVVEERAKGTFIIAEESTAWKGVTDDTSNDGLGFTFKWNMGWMNDFLEYMKLDPLFKKYQHGKLTFSMLYAYNENFIQVLSHDEVVHGKGSMIEKMPGEYNDKFANLRLAYSFMYGHPGKKLLFMGQEFAQFREWSERRSLDWDILAYEKHYKLQAFVKKLNHLYKQYNAFYINDYDSIGFEWMDCSDNERSIVSFVRRGDTKNNQLLFIYNFTPIIRNDYIIPVPCEGLYTEILSSDDTQYGGNGLLHTKPIRAFKEDINGKTDAIQLTIPPLCCMIFKFDFVENKIKNKQQLLEEIEKQRLYKETEIMKQINNNIYLPTTILKVKRKKIK